MVGLDCCPAHFGGLQPSILRQNPGTVAVYQWMNIVGAVGFTINCVWNAAWPSVALNVVWVGIGIYALRQILIQSGLLLSFPLFMNNSGSGSESMRGARSPRLLLDGLDRMMPPSR
jgi:hypothetical protein